MAHIEEAKAREFACFQHSLLQKLLLHLFDLHGLHLAAVWCEFSSRLFAQCNQLLLWCRAVIKAANIFSSSTLRVRSSSSSECVWFCAEAERECP